MPAGTSVYPYRLFSHDGSGNFSLILEFVAPNDEAAALLVDRWRIGPLELWLSTRKVKLSANEQDFRGGADLRPGVHFDGKRTSAS